MAPGISKMDVSKNRGVNTPQNVFFKFHGKPNPIKNGKNTHLVPGLQILVGIYNQQFQGTIVVMVGLTSRVSLNAETSRITYFGDIKQCKCMVIWGICPSKCIVWMGNIMTPVPGSQIRRYWQRSSQARQERHGQLVGPGADGCGSGDIFLTGFGMGMSVQNFTHIPPRSLTARP